MKDKATQLKHKIKKHKKQTNKSKKIRDKTSQTVHRKETKYIIRAKVTCLMSLGYSV